MKKTFFVSIDRRSLNLNSQIFSSYFFQNYRFLRDTAVRVKNSKSAQKTGLENHVKPRK